MTRENTLLCVGECMVEMSPAGSGGYSMGFAGDTFNTAWYARRLLGPDWNVGYGSCVGSDEISGQMLEFIRAAGVDTSTVRQLEDRTVGLYLIQLANGERSFCYWRGQSAARALADDPDWLDDVFGRASVLLFSGITLAILSDRARTAFCGALARARVNGVQIVFDTNMRARLWPNGDVMRRGIMQGAAQADIVLPSLDEEEAAFGDHLPQDVATRYHQAGASLVVVKNGAGEMLVSDRAEGQFSMAPPPVRKVVDTTAAGDSFNAGFLAARLQGKGLQAAVGQGARLAAQVIQAPGALVDPD